MQITANILNEVSAYLGTDDKNLAISALAAALVQGGHAPDAVLKMIIGEAGYADFIDTLYTSLRAE